jgi:hypothetical protein
MYITIGKKIILIISQGHPNAPFSFWGCCVCPGRPTMWPCEAKLAKWSKSQNWQPCNLYMRSRTLPHSTLQFVHSILRSRDFRKQVCRFAWVALGFFCMIQGISWFHQTSASTPSPHHIRYAYASDNICFHIYFWSFCICLCFRKNIRINVAPLCFVRFRSDFVHT